MDERGNQRRAAPAKRYPTRLEAV